MKEYEAALAKNPKLVGAHMVLGMVYERKKEYAQAKAKYEEALKLDPKFGPAANNLAWLLSEEGANLDQALAYAQTAREQQPNDPSVRRYPRLDLLQEKRLSQSQLPAEGSG